jgi:hypothetical protein
MKIPTHSTKKEKNKSYEFRLRVHQYDLAKTG